MSYRDKVEGNELDLSLNQLTDVPVKELAAASKATHLDLSCNRIQTLPNDFATLTHLVKIDLSKNKLTELPGNFGNLQNLQNLDLYGNQIVSLPVSFCKLKNLRWLDLKNNPLEPKLKNVAGDCLDEKECHACAKKVVAYMQSIDSDLEREKQKNLKVAREKEAIERAKIEKELEEQRRLKKLEKERRKAESRAKREAQASQDEFPNDHGKISNLKNEKEQIDKKRTKPHGAKGFSCATVFLYSVLAACLVLLLGFLYGIHTEIISTTDIKVSAEQALRNLQSCISEVLKLVLYYIPKVREIFLKIVHQYMLTVTHLASQVEQMLSVYF